MRVPPAPVVSAALSGFVVGVIVTLMATGSMARGGPSATPGTAPTVVPTPGPRLSDAALVARVSEIVTRELGPPPNKAEPRLIKVAVSPGAPQRNFGPPGTQQALRTVIIRFRLNNHPLGGTWRLRAAKADVFLVLRALYSSTLPIGSVEMVGVFPLSSKGKVSPRKSLEIYIDSDTARTLQWHKMSRDEVNETRVWRALDYKWVDPRFG
jgi:hypothetical protein